ncbi:MAG: cysteine desulfurase [Bdellovibrionales bacterium]|nr:cysteine desulfurase [Bdellovibrionales bacterium]
MNLSLKRRIYLDNNATTKPRSSALEGVKKALKSWGNPSSTHQNASQSKALLWSARENLSSFLNCHPLEIIFTSGASESNNHAIKALFQNLETQSHRQELILSAVEHPSVLTTGDFLKKQGKTVHYIPVSRKGFLDEDFLEKHLSDKTLLVSIMKANNETGILFPIEKWIQKAHEKGALFHSDMVQALGKEKIDLKKLGIDLASFSGHKFYSLQGCGLLYCKKGIHLDQFIHGGSQERKRRAGTENLVGITAFGEVAKEGEFIITESKRLRFLRNHMEKTLLSSLDNIEVIGQEAPRLSNTSCLLIKGIPAAESLMMNLDLKGISISVGSACHSGKLESNTVLTSMGLTTKESLNCIRISLGLENTKEEIDYFTKTILSSIQYLRNLD